MTALRRTAAIAPVAGLLIVMAAPRASANWSPLPGGVSVSTHANADRNPLVCPDGAGGAIVAWTANRDWRQQIYVQRLNADGVALWTVNGVRAAPSSYDQETMKIVSDGAGGAFLTWSENRSTNADIYTQRVTGAGAVAPGWPAAGLQVSSSTKDEYQPHVVPDGSGGVLIAWTLVFSTSDWDVYATRVTSAGMIAPGWVAGGTTVNANSNNQQDACLAPDGAEGAIVGWIETVPSLSQTIWAKRLTGAGATAPGWADWGNRVCTGSAWQVDPVVVADGAGGAIFAWDDRRPERAVFAERMDGAGSVLWDPAGVRLGDLVTWAAYFAVAPDGSHGAHIVWMSEGSLDDADIYAQHVDGSGTVGWTPTGRKLSESGAHHAYPKLAADGAGGIYVTWSSNADAASSDVVAQHVVSDGRIAWPHGGLVLCNAARAQYYSEVAGDGAGGAIFAWHDTRLDDYGDVYAVQVTGWSNLTWALVAGWDSPSVPRASGDATTTYAPLPATLPGEVADTWLNWTAHQTGPNAVPFPFRTDLWFDEGSSGGTATNLIGDPKMIWAVMNAGPVAFRGGRHSLTSVADRYDDIPESDETDNVWRGQWVWSPITTAAGTPHVRYAPPEPALAWFTNPNCDGFRFDRHPNYAWVVAQAPWDPGDDYDLVVYDDYSGSTSGFSSVLRSSGVGSNIVDYVVGHFQGTPTTVYPAVTRYSVDGGGQYFSLDQETASGRNATASYRWLNQELAPHRLVDVYEVYLTAGQTVHFQLLRSSGPSDLALSVYPGTPGQTYDRYHPAAAIAQQLNPNAARLAFTASVTGWHPVVVCRHTGTGADTPMVYSLTFSTEPIVDVPEQRPASVLAFAGAAPNPATSTARLSFSLAGAGPVRLAIHDVSGRRMRVLADGEFAAGPHAVTWDGRDAAGTPVGAGLYWARLEAGGRVLTRRLTMLR